MVKCYQQAAACHVRRRPDIVRTVIFVTCAFIEEEMCFCCVKVIHLSPCSVRLLIQV